MASCCLLSILTALMIIMKYTKATLNGSFNIFTEEVASSGNTVNSFNNEQSENVCERKNNYLQWYTNQHVDGAAFVSQKTSIYEEPDECKPMECFSFYMAFILDYIPKCYSGHDYPNECNVKYHALLDLDQSKDAQPGIDCDGLDVATNNDTLKDSMQIKYEHHSVTNHTALMDPECNDQPISVRHGNNDNSILLNDEIMSLINDKIQKAVIQQIKDINNTWQIRYDLLNDTYRQQIKHINDTWQIKYALLNDTMQKKDKEYNKQTKDINDTWQTEYTSLVETMRQKDVAHAKETKDINDTIKKKDTAYTQQIKDIIDGCQANYTLLNDKILRTDIAHNKEIKDVNDALQMKYANLSAITQNQDITYNKQLKDINDTFQTIYASLQDAIQKRDMAYNKQITDINDTWQNKYSSLNDTIILLNDTVQIYMMPCIEKIQIMNNSWQNKYELLSNSYSKAVTKNEKLNDDVSRLNDEINTFHTQYALLNASYYSSVGRNANISAINEHLNEQIMTITRLKTTCRNELNSLEEDIQSLKDTHNQQIKDINGAWETELGACNVQLSKERKKFTQRENEWEKMNAELSDKKEALDDCLKENNVLTDQKEKCEERSTSWFGS